MSKFSLRSPAAKIPIPGAWTFKIVGQDFSDVREAGNVDQQPICH